jgi:glutaredoxin 3
MSTSRIVLFATASCPYCDEARAAIVASGESWEERNPNSSPETLRELLMHAASASVPTIVIGNRALVGWDRDRFDQMLSQPPFEPPVSAPETAEERAEADPVLPDRG